MRIVKTLKTSFLYFFLSFSCLTYSQNRVIKEGNREYDRFAFINSRDYYLELAEKDTPPQELLERLGNSYYFTADYVNAAKWYKKLFANYKKAKAEYLYRYALAVKSTGNYTVSDSLMNSFYALRGTDFRAQLFNKQRDYLKEIEMQSNRYEINKVSFNSPMSDFAPAFYGDSIVFSSSRGRVSLEKNIHLWNNQPFLDLYKVTDLNKENRKNTVKEFDKSINTKFHESTAVFSNDFKTVYFTRNNYFNNVYQEDSQGVNLLKLFRADKVKGKWIVKELPFNSNEYSVAHPALSTDGKTLYFSSDMPGGFGQADLYKVEIKGTGYGTPVNLGSSINTEGRETFPSISKDNKLYFSSDGHIGLGGLDIFTAEIDSKGMLGDSFNLGKPLNSKYDDITFIMNSTTRIGYFSSNRDNEPYNDDIYEVLQKQDIISKCSQFLKGNIKDAKTNEPIADTEIQLYDQDNKLISTTKSLKDGSYSFDKELLCQKVYSIRIAKSIYAPIDLIISTAGMTQDTIHADVLLERETLIKNTDLARIMNLKPIKFEFDQSKIAAESESELNKVIEVMQLFPDIKIEVRSHTDNRGTAVYNKALSDKRAKSTIAYIIEKGKIDPNRISGKGYGEAVPLYDCDKILCTPEQHHANRRSEFIIR